LYGFTPEPTSLVSGISKVPAGSIAELDLATGSLDVRRYWSMLEHLGGKPLTTDLLRRTIEDAVEACCQSDVPVGIALSGGLDSSMVALIASRARSDLTAFSIGYSGGPSDESSMAAGLASDLGISHVVSHLDARQVGASFAEVCMSRDEPVSDIAGPSLSAVSKAAHDAGVPVLLTGMGGDELFWGYEWSRRLASYAFAQLSPAGSPSAEYSLRQLLPHGTTAGLAQWLETVGGVKIERDLETYFTRWGSDQSTPIALFEFQYGYPGILRDITRLCDVEPGFPRPRAWMPRSDHLVPGYYINALCETYLRVNGLGQIDRLSMHHSVESRTPLVDYRLAEVVLSCTMHGDDGLSEAPKARLRQVAKELLPAHVINRPKRGFTPPVREWVAEIWRFNKAALSSDSCLAESGLMNPGRVRDALRRPLHRTGRVNQIALRLATLELWARSF
jgi:asparagine synthase (glutamine-hydrolysing)